MYRSDGYFAVEEIGHLAGWSRDGSVAKLLANEFELGIDPPGIIEQRGRGGDAQLRLRVPAAEIQLGELPDTVKKLFGRERSASMPMEDLRPQPIVDRDLANAVVEALRSASPDVTLQVRPAYQGGSSSLVFRGLALRALGATQGRPSAMSVLIKLPLGISAGKLVVNAQALDHERTLLSARAGWPGLPARVEQLRVDLGPSRPLAAVLQTRYGVEVRPGELIMDALVLPLGHPRTIEAEPRLLSSIIDEPTGPVHRLTRRNIHNVLTVADRLARLLRMFHCELHAHRHLSIDAIIVRYELGIFEHILAPDLAASVKVATGTDDLLYRDLFDLGRVLVHLITGAALSQERQNFQPPEFQGRRLIKRSVVGEGETVSRLLFAVSRYLLEASPEAETDDPREDATVWLLDHFLDEVEHIGMLHWARARGVPERRVSLAGATPAGPQGTAPPREVWDRSPADPVATRLVTISHLVDVPTLRRWCERYVTSADWYASIAERRDAVSSDPPPIPSVDRCLELLRRGFGRSGAAEMWRYLWNAGQDEPVENLLRILRNYATHWTREDRYDVSHSFGAWRTVDGRGESKGLGDELDALKQVSAGVPGRQRFVHWLDEMKRLRPRKGTPAEPRRDASRASERIQAEREDERLRSWIRAAALMRQLESKTAPPLEKDIYALERTLQARSSPEIAFWHVLLARAWASSAAHGMVARAIDDDPPWNKAMRALIVAAGVASSRRLPYEMASGLLAAASLTRIALSTPELRAEFSTQGVDEESVRVQGAECALLAADAYQWLDAEHHHWGALLDAAALLQGSAFPERLIQAFQLLALARNNRLLYREHHEIPRDALDAPAQLERYPLAADAGASRAPREDRLFDEIYRSWLTAPGRIQTSDDPGTIVTHGYFSRYIPGVQQLLRSSSLSSSLRIEFDAEPGAPVKAVDRLLALVEDHYRRPAVTRILDFGCGAGDDARHLARCHEVWAVDSPLWFAAADTAPPPAGAPPAARFLEIDPVEYARRVRDGKPPDGSPRDLDVVLFRCSLCRISHRATLLEAAHKLLKPGGLVIATDWVQTRVTDRITWSKLVGTARLADVETEPGYRRLCDKLGFVDFVSWDWTAERDARAPAMQRWFQRRLDEVRRLEDERSGPRRSPYERAFLLRFKRDLEAFVGLSGPDGPLGWVFWAARKPGGAS